MAAREKTRDELDMKTLRELAALPSNKYCFDCGQRGPTYVNVTIGAFVCSACGGILRGLNPPHRVKSLTVCSFTEVEMDRIKSRGNEYCTHIWLGRYDAKSSGGATDLSTPERRREFMRLKYEERTYYVDPREIPLKTKPRAPPVPQSKSQTDIGHNNNTSTSPLYQKSGALSQTFSAGDVLSNSASNLFSDFENDPFNGPKQGETKAVEASFADFSSAFGHVDSSGQSQDNPSLSSSSNAPLSHKKPAPPPPDRYAALADLDSQQHHQAPPTEIPDPPGAPTTVFWSPGTVFAPPASQNPFGGSPWPAQNPFVGGPHKPTVFPQQASLPNGSPSLWPNPAWALQTTGQPDAFQNKAPISEACNPWSQSFGANPFMNFGSANGGKNPFL